MRTGPRLIAIVVTVLLSAGCGASTAARSSEVDTLRASMAAHDAALDSIEARAARLSEAWRDVVDEYHAATLAFRAAQARFEEARERGEETTSAFEQARADYETAARWQRFYQSLIVVAAQVDATNVDAYRAAQSEGAARSSEPFSCAPVSTAAYRRMLIGQGVNLVGLDVDHIVPRSLGGADHPSNYQLLPASTNRSLGNRWDRSKCLMAAEQCGQAVAVSRACGSYRGTMP